MWQVQPTSLERRFIQRRMAKQARVDAPERRTGQERRTEKFSRSPVAAEFASGWLCFQSGGERRRLAPVPEEWDRADDETIEQWCCVAKPVMRRPSDLIPGTGTEPRKLP